MVLVCLTAKKGGLLVDRLPLKAEPRLRKHVT
jgi:hypothetical protein